MKISSLLLLFSGALLLAGCAGLQPHRYAGDGVWVRGDGTTYEAPPPLGVTDAEIIGTDIKERVRVEEQRTTNDKGETIIREREIREMDVAMDVRVELENGETYQLFFSGSGTAGSQTAVNSSFSASNGYVYGATGTLYLIPDKPRLHLSINSKGPVRYQNTLFYEDGAG